MRGAADKQQTKGASGPHGGIGEPDWQILKALKRRCYTV